MNNWLSKRGIPFRREDYDLIMREYGVRDSRELTILSNGLNLTDHFWLCPVKNEKKWEEVNFLDNTFSSRIGEILPELAEKYEEFINPDFSSNGRLKKFWTIEGSERVLCKDGSGDIRQEPFNEKAVSDIAGYLGIERVEYRLEELDGVYYSKCGCMIDRDLEFVNAFMVYLEDGNTGNRYNDYIGACEKKGILNASEEVGKMIILDYLVRNTDRHVGNFGILRNSETLKWERVAPLFDNGNSFWHDAQGVNFIDGGASSRSRSFNKTNEGNLALVGDRGWFKSEKLNGTPHMLRRIFKLNKNLDETRINKIIKEYEHRVNNFQTL